MNPSLFLNHILFTSISNTYRLYCKSCIPLFILPVLTTKIRVLSIMPRNWQIQIFEDTRLTLHSRGSLQVYSLCRGWCLPGISSQHSIFSSQGGPTWALDNTCHKLQISLTHSWRGWCTWGACPCSPSRGSRSWWSGSGSMWSQCMLCCLSNKY